MPDVNELKKWLKIADLPLNQLVDIVDGGQIKEIEFEDKETKIKKKSSVLEIGVSINRAIRKGLALNKPSIQSLSQEWGNDTNLWVGKIAIVQIVKTMSFGKLVDIKYLAPTPSDVHGWDDEKTK